MSRDFTNDFIAKQNAEFNKPIWLYRINISDTPEASGEGDLYFAQANEDIEFYETNDGVHTARTYLRWPIRHAGISENAEGRIDSFQLTAANVTRELQAWAEERDFFRGRKVTVRLVDRDLLSNPLSYMEDIFTIDSYQSDTKRIRFSLTSELALLQVEVPRRIMLRGHCPWRYKGLGCWHEDVNGDPTQPPEFYSDSTPLNWLTKTKTGDDSNPAQPAARFAPVNLKNVDVTTDILIVELRCSDPSAMTAASQIEIGSAGQEDSEELSLTDLTGLGITSSWLFFPIALADFTDSGIDWTNVNWFRVYSHFSTPGPHTLEWRNPRIRLYKPFGTLMSNLDTCNKTEYHCRLHGNTKQFGGWPNIPSIRRIQIG